MIKIYRVEGSLEEFETYEEAETELFEIMDTDEILEFMDCSCGEILRRFLHRKDVAEFELWFSIKIEEAIERMKDELIAEYEEEEDE